MSNPTTPTTLKAEQERVKRLLEGITEGEWFCYGDDELRVGVVEDDITYILADDISNPQDATLMAESQRLARAYAALLDAHLALHAQLAQAKGREARMEQNALKALFYAIGQHPNGQAEMDWSAYRVSFGRGVYRGYGDTALKQVISAVCQASGKHDPYAQAGEG